MARERGAPRARDLHLGTGLDPTCPLSEACLVWHSRTWHAHGMMVSICTVAWAWAWAWYARAWYKYALQYTTSMGMDMINSHARDRHVKCGGWGGFA